MASPGVSLSPTRLVPTGLAAVGGGRVDITAPGTSSLISERCRVWAEPASLFGDEGFR